MGKIVKSIVTVAAFAFATVATGGTFLVAEASLLSATLLGAAVGGVLGVLTSLITPKQAQVDEQAGAKLPVYNAADTRKIIYGRVRVAGTEIFIEEYDANGQNDVPNDTLIFARVVADHPVTAYGQFWIGDQKINFASDANQNVANSGNATTAKYQNKLYLRTHDGTQVSWDGRLGQASGGWTAAHIGTGIAYYTLKANFDAEVFPYGAGEFRNCSVEVDGKPVYDPRKDGSLPSGVGLHRIGTPATWEFSTNPALCIYDYLRDDVLGNPVPDIEINTDAIIAAANICDEQVAVAAGGTINRYSLNGMVDSNRDKFSNVQTMLTAMAGRIMWLGGEIHIFAASERTATHLLDEDVILSAQYDPMPPADSRFNEVRGTFISPAENFEPQDFPPLIDAAEQLLEGERAQSLNLPYTQDHRIAQRLSKIMLYNSRQAMLNITALPAAVAFAPMDVISVSWKNFGLVGEDFRIISQTINGGSGTSPATVSLSLVREDASVYSWTALEEQVRGTKPTLKVVDPTLSPVPTGVGVNAETLTSLDYTSQTSLRISWNAPNAAVAATYVDYRVTGTATWLPAGSSTRGDTDLRLFLPPSQSYEVQVRHLYMSGNYSLNVQHAARSTETIAGADRLAHRGAYDALVPYLPGDVVTSGGSSYLFIGITEATGIAVSNTAYWSLLARVGDVGPQGAPGADGLNNAVVLIYQRKTSVPALPIADTTYTFSTKSLSGLPVGWTQTIPAGTAPLYVSGATASSITNTDIIAATEWSGATVMAQNGNDGQSGPAGLNSATVFLYQRAASAPPLPTVSTTYTFATKTLTAAGSGWTQTVPAGTLPIYVTTATAVSNLATDTILNTEWAAPQILAQNGDTGAPGADGAGMYAVSINETATGTVNNAYIRFFGYTAGAADKNTPAKIQKTDGSFFSFGGTSGNTESTLLIHGSNTGGYTGYYIVVDLTGGQRFIHGTGTGAGTGRHVAACRKANDGSWTYMKQGVGWPSLPSTIHSEYRVIGTADRNEISPHAWLNYSHTNMTLDAAPELGAVRISDTANITVGAVTNTKQVTDFGSPQAWLNLPLKIEQQRGSISLTGYSNSTDRLIIQGYATLVFSAGKSNVEIRMIDANGVARGSGFVTDQSHTTGSADKFTVVPFLADFSGNVAMPIKAYFKCTYLGTGAKVYVRETSLVAKISLR